MPEETEKLKLNFRDGEDSLFPAAEWAVVLYDDGCLCFESAGATVETRFVDEEIEVPDTCPTAIRKRIEDWLEAPSAMSPDFSNRQLAFILNDMQNEEL